MLITLIVFLIVLATLILVHELGHFLVARRNGVGAEEFGFGFPPRIVGTYKDKHGKRRWVFGNKEISEEIKNREETVYSLNLIPLGGFVKIKGEDGEDRTDPSSFAARSIWTRFKILAAGVTMNLVLGIVLLTFALWMGLPEAIGDEENVPNSKVIISQVMPKTPAKDAGVAMGDEVLSVTTAEGKIAVTTVSQLQQAIKGSAEKEISLEVKHAGEKNISPIKVTPRKNEQGEGQIGVALARTVVRQHGFFEAIPLAFQVVFVMIKAILGFLGSLVTGLFTSKEVSADVAGPVGIAILTGQAVRMGLAYLLNFAALLSINLAIINFLPFPALDGGRALFLLFEKIKGAPVSQKVEGLVHTAGFLFLLGVMALVIVGDFINFEVFDKLKNVF